MLKEKAMRLKSRSKENTDIKDQENVTQNSNKVVASDITPLGKKIRSFSMLKKHKSIKKQPKLSKSSPDLANLNINLELDDKSNIKKIHKSTNDFFQKDRWQNSNSFIRKLYDTYKDESTKSKRVEKTNQILNNPPKNEHQLISEKDELHQTILKLETGKEDGKKKSHSNVQNITKTIKNNHKNQKKERVEKNESKINEKENNEPNEKEQIDDDYECRCSSISFVINSPLSTLSKNYKMYNCFYDGYTYDRNNCLCKCGHKKGRKYLQKKIYGIRTEQSASFAYPMHAYQRFVDVKFDEKDINQYNDNSKMKAESNII
ncbi:hypothetical protein BB559_007354 [Furculomyces boomerangus]|uniref:Uncharacterized protein n=1 Tax=Furculomyces boomerangus TaxID=61424 RepID=A0A2T9XXL4_9FUNG|nr:hypothetical protein BB559_007354 [Furculomyces boomerangus]